MTVPEKRDLAMQNKKIEFLMLVGRFNPPLCCVKILKDKTWYAWRADWPNLTYSSRAIENEKRNIKKEVDKLEIAVNSVHCNETYNFNICILHY